MPQGLVSASICRQTQLALEACLAVVAEARAGRLRLPEALCVHRHCGSVDLPRHGDGTPAAALHPQRQHRDWRPLTAGDPLFWCADGTVIGFEPGAMAQPAGADPAARWPVFINEAAYGEKGIAFSLCVRERWPCEPGWIDALAAL